MLTSGVNFYLIDEFIGAVFNFHTAWKKKLKKKSFFLILEPERSASGRAGRNNNVEERAGGIKEKFGFGKECRKCSLPNYFGRPYQNAGEFNPRYKQVHKV